MSGSPTAQRLIGSSVVGILAIAVNIVTSLFLLPFQLIRVHGYPATEAGAALLPLSIGLAVLSPISGVLSGRIGVRAMLTIGPLLAAAGFAGDLDVGQEAHLDLLHTLAFAVLAAAARAVEREAPRPVAAHARLGRLREQAPHGIPEPDIGGRAGARRLADRRLIDLEHAADLLPPFERATPHRLGCAFAALFSALRSAAGYRRLPWSRAWTACLILYCLCRGERKLQPPPALGATTGRNPHGRTGRPTRPVSSRGRVPGCGAESGRNAR